MEALFVLLDCHFFATIDCMASYQTAVHLWRNPKSGSWYLVWREGGKPRRRSTYTKNSVKAQAILEATIRELGSAPTEVPELTFHQAMVGWLADRSRPLRNLSKVTIKEYSTFVKQIKGISQPRLMAAEVKPADIRAMLDTLQRRFNFSSSTVRKRYGALRMLFAWMVEEDIIRKSPVKKGDAPFAQAKQRIPWTAVDYRVLQKAISEEMDAEDSSSPTRRCCQDLSDLVTVLWLSGMRSIQAYRLTWDGVDLENMVWQVRSPRQNKGGEKLQPIHQELKELLERRRLLGGELVFPAQGRMTTFWSRFKERRSEFRGWSFHQARSRVVTALREMGEHAAALGLVGQTKEKTNELYNHAGADEFRKALNRL